VTAARRVTELSVAPVMAAIGALAALAANYSIEVERERSEVAPTDGKPAG